MDERLLEVCVDDAPGLHAAIAGGANRIELCAALTVGGLTPSPGLMAAAAGSPVPVYAMIRPRSGDFVFAETEIEIMLADIDHARHCGLSGVVLGASLPDGRLDAAVLRRLCMHAQGLGTTLHRAFDLVPSFADAIEIAVELGFERILTSGGAPTVLQGLDQLERIVALAGNRISIMPGGGVKAENAAELIARLGVRELHASGGLARGPAGEKILELGFDAASRRATDKNTVAAVKAAMGGR
ncbi:copper homeostasis protein CutC [Chelativorans sp. AA-79]|uniref:copper homeostasis protein CutC n=1 Tax=Chelativorans sp. AA-79 TaxID=3028735 RepID=UPI0023F9D9B3|nr:copper homeostasis protein CutC [Chelativorans sp. AA-79]WEX11015.1 copper homeostasis protein CutC [Chelativorans sp. AA-79]